MIKKLLAFLLLIIFFVFSVLETSHAGVTVANLGSYTTWTKSSQEKKLCYSSPVSGWIGFYMKSGTANTLFDGLTTNRTSFTENSVALNGTVTTDGGTVTSLCLSNGAVIATYWNNTVGQVFRYMRGSASDGVVSWPGANTVYLRDSDKNALDEPMISITLNTGNKLFAAHNEGSANVNSELSDNTVTTSFADSYGNGPGTTFNSFTLPINIDYGKAIAIYPLASGHMLLFRNETSSGNPLVRFSTFDGTATWAAYADLYTASATADARQWDASQASLTNTCFLGITATSTMSMFCYNGSSFTTESTPPWPTSGLTTNSSIVLENNGTDYLAIVIRGDANKTLSICKYTVGSNSWCGAWTDVEQTTSGVYVSGSANIDTVNGNFAVLYTKSSADLVFACFKIDGSGCTGGGVGGGGPPPAQNPVIFFDGDDLD